MTPARRRMIHELLVRVADGDRGSFRAAFAALWPVLLEFFSKALPIREDAEDAAQRALLKVFAQIADLDRGRDAVAWTVTIASYEVLTVRNERSRRRETVEAGLPFVADGAPLPDEQAQAAELRLALRTTFGELTDRDRRALAEILEDHDLDRGETARKRRFRAVERLRAVWGKIHG